MQIDLSAVLFDVDGTLVDSTPAVERIWTRWAVDRGLDPAEILQVSHGRRTADTLALFLPEHEREPALAELSRLEATDTDGVMALPHARELLDQLPSDRWAAVTSGTRAIMAPRLTLAGLPVPDVFVTADDVSAGKPDPQGYRMAAGHLGVDVTRCLVVEDAPAGIRAGRAAGATVLAVTTSHTADAVREADIVVPDLRECTIEVRPDGLRVTIDG